MKFVHVIRDGRDISLGNEFVERNRYVDAYLTRDERSMPGAQKMMLFWGRSNEKARDYGVANLRERYKMFRWEDLCAAPIESSSELIQFAGGVAETTGTAARLVGKPTSIGRWRTFPSKQREPVLLLGSKWLSMFGYQTEDVD